MLKGGLKKCTKDTIHHPCGLKCNLLVLEQCSMNTLDKVLKYQVYNGRGIIAYIHYFLVDDQKKEGKAG